VVSGGGFTVTGSGKLDLSRVRIVAAATAVNLQTTGNFIHDNFIGAVLPGDSGNTMDGVLSAGGNYIETNYIAGNGPHGVELTGAGGDFLRGNVIGLRCDGATAPRTA
jgi:hypothetical protein